MGALWVFTDKDTLHRDTGAWCKKMRKRLIFMFFSLLFLSSPPVLYVPSLRYTYTRNIRFELQEAISSPLKYDVEVVAPH